MIRGIVFGQLQRVCINKIGKTQQSFAENRLSCSLQMQSYLYLRYNNLKTRQFLFNFKLAKASLYLTSSLFTVTLYFPKNRQALVKSEKVISKIDKLLPNLVDFLVTPRGFEPL